MADELSCTRAVLRTTSLDLAAKVQELEARRHDAEELQHRLEEAKGELGLTRSRVLSIERELHRTRR